MRSPPCRYHLFGPWRPRERLRTARGSAISMSSTRPALSSPRCTRKADATPKKGYDIVLIGHLGHPELEGTLGQIPGKVHVISEPPTTLTQLAVADPERVAFVTQTTLLGQRHQGCDRGAARQIPERSSDLTRATSATRRKTARPRYIELSKKVDLLLVVGANNSSNSNRLREIGQNFGLPSYLIEYATMLDPRLDQRGRRRSGSPPAPPPPKCWRQEKSTAGQQYRSVTVETSTAFRRTCTSNFLRSSPKCPDPRTPWMSGPSRPPDAAASASPLDSLVRRQ